jgi:serine/threonine protein kinase
LRNFLEVVGSLEEEESALYFAEMITAVHDLHELGYLHRDLKPDNCKYCFVHSPSFSPFVYLLFLPRYLI